MSFPRLTLQSCLHGLSASSLSRTATHRACCICSGLLRVRSGHWPDAAQPKSKVRRFLDTTVGFTSAGRGDIGLLRIAEADAPTTSGKLQGVAHGNVGCWLSGGLHAIAQVNSGDPGAYTESRSGGAAPCLMGGPRYIAMSAQGSRSPWPRKIAVILHAIQRDEPISSGRWPVAFRASVKTVSIDYAFWPFCSVHLASG